MVHITHINGEHVFSVKDAEDKLKAIFTAHASTIKGGVDNSNSDNSNSETLNSNSPTTAPTTLPSPTTAPTKLPSKLEFTVTFAPEKRLYGKKLKKAIGDFYHFVPGTTKNIKLKPDLEEVPNDMDDDSERNDVGTTIYKMFSGIEYQGKVTGYDPSAKVYHVEYEDGDCEDFYHLEIKQHRKIDKSLVKKKRFKFMKDTQLQVIHSRFAPKEDDYDDHIWTMSLEEVRAIAALRTGLECNEHQVPNEMIRLAIKSLTSDSMIEEEQDMGFMTRKKLKATQLG